MKLLLYLFLSHLIRFSRSQHEHSSSQNDRELIAGGRGGGEPIDYQVLIQHDGSFVCGGVLIASDVVLTSAVNCAASSLASYEIHLGVYDRTENPPMVRSVVQEEIHPEYEPLDSTSARNDILLLKLNESVTGYNPIVLNSDPAIPAVNEFVVVTGWGVEETGGQFSDELLSTQVQIISSEICEENLMSFVLDDGEIGDGEICTFTVYRGACDGDFGGPVVIQNFNGAPLLVGMSSWGLTCGYILTAEVNMRISSYLYWIQATMCFTFDSTDEYDFCNSVNAFPTSHPTKAPIVPSSHPSTSSPTTNPTKSPTKTPVISPSSVPPIRAPTKSPTNTPMSSPSLLVPSIKAPTKNPTKPQSSITISETTSPTTSSTTNKNSMAPSKSSLSVSTTGSPIVSDTNSQIETTFSAAASYPTYLGFAWLKLSSLFYFSIMTVTFCFI